MELEHITIGSFALHSLDKFHSEGNEVTIIRTFELNSTKYISFVSSIDSVLKTLSVDKFKNQYELYLDTLVSKEKNTENNSECECTDCK